MTTSNETPYFAFKGDRLVAEGAPSQVALQLKAEQGEERLRRGEILVFSGSDGRQIDLHLVGSEADADLRVRLAVTDELVAAPEGVAGAIDTDPPKRGRGRPRLGVVGREITLLPRHWEWLDRQRGGASATLRRLVDAERKATVTQDEQRLSQDRTNRFLSAMAGDLAGCEDATRARYAGDRAGFEVASVSWCADIRRVAMQLADAAFG